MRAPLPCRIFSVIFLAFYTWNLSPEGITHSLFRRSYLGNPQLACRVGCRLSDMLLFLCHWFSSRLHEHCDNRYARTKYAIALMPRVSGTFPRPIEKETRNSQYQIQGYPHICLTLQVSRALLPLGNSPLSCRAMFPYQLSPFG